MKKYLATLALLAAVPVHAGDLTLDVNGYSRHNKDTYLYRGKSHDYNERNLGVGVTYGVNKYVDVSAGFYDNSYYHTSVYAAVRIGRDLVLGGVVFSPGIQAGFATGYVNTPVHSAYFRPIVQPNLRVSYRGVGVTVGYVPRIRQEKLIPVSAVTVQINISLGKTGATP